MYTKDRTEEQILVMRAARGEQDAFRVLVERYQHLTYTLALRLVGNEEDARDVAQEAFLAAWKALPKFRMDAKFSTWLYRLTVNCATDLLRKRKEAVSLDGEAVQAADCTPTPQEQAERAERKEILHRCIALLSENHRKILVLREVHGLDYEEIGQVLELTPGTVKSRLARARMELRKLLLSQGNFFEENASNTAKGGDGQ